MTLTKISPLSNRPGLGTYETFFDKTKYQSLQQALYHKDVAIVDFVKDEYGTIYFEAYTMERPDYRLHHKLNFQQFPFGVDYSDDVEACVLVSKLWKMPEPFNPLWN